MTLTRTAKEESLWRSYQAAQAITRRYARTFYFASHALPPEKRYASYALYAFCRAADSAVDDNHPNPTQVLEELQLLLRGEATSFPWAAAWRDTQARFQVPLPLHEELLQGVKMDLYRTRYETFEELYLYCYRVAGVVGQMMTYILGFRDEKALLYAEKLGVAMQLTNILRDIGEDWQRGRVYLPQAELQQFGYSVEDIAGGRITPGFYRLMTFQVERARSFYSEGRKGIPLLLEPSARLTTRLMANLYEGILDELEAQNYPSLQKRVYVPLPKKLLRSLPEALREASFTLTEELLPLGKYMTIATLLLGAAAIFSLNTGFFSEWRFMDGVFLTLWSFTGLYIAGQGKNHVAAVVVAVLGWLIEVIGVHTGWPFGAYSYTHALQPQLLGVPVPIALAWGALVGLSSYAFGALPRWSRALAVGTLTVSIDIALEPFATTLRNYWTWAGGDIPWTNYLTWFGFSGLLALAFQGSKSPPDKRRALVLLGLLCLLLWSTLISTGMGKEVLLSIGGVFLLWKGAAWLKK